MTIDPAPFDARLILLDIEGTTTPVAFVHDVLFPYARTRIDAWFDANRRGAVAGRLMAALSAERDRDARRGEDVPAVQGDEAEDAARYVHWLMDRDRKSPALKELQGIIWEDGYKAGELRGTVYPDVPPAFERWRRAGRTIAIYSSGSELAQRRLFESTEAGDLTPAIAAFFDTRVGAKRDAASYVRIAAAMECDPREILFVSDVAAELDAAGAAGCHVVLSLRPGNPPEPRAAEFASVHSLAEII